MKRIGFITMLAAVFLMGGCKSDEGLADADKSKFIKTYSTLAEGADILQTADGGFIMLGTTQGDFLSPQIGSKPKPQ